MKISTREALARGAAQLHAAGIESARLDARILLSRAMEVPTDRLFLSEPSPDQNEIYETLIARRIGREPLAYIVGTKEFWSRDFEVGPGVLIPRPESETLMEDALHRYPDAGAPLRALDIGTGSGCLLISFLLERQSATGVGIDTSSAALRYAKRNAARHGLGDRCVLETKLRRAAFQFDIIFANPPYLTDAEFEDTAPEIHEYEPRQAFVAGPDGLEAMRTFLPIFVHGLTADGLGFLEIGAGQAELVTGIARAAGLELRHVVHDLSGIPRCLVFGRAGKGGLGRH